MIVKETKLHNQSLWKKNSCKTCFTPHWKQTKVFWLTKIGFWQDVNYVDAKTSPTLKYSKKKNEKRLLLFYKPFIKTYCIVVWDCLWMSRQWGNNYNVVIDGTVFELFFLKTYNIMNERKKMHYYDTSHGNAAKTLWRNTTCSCVQSLACIGRVKTWFVKHESKAGPRWARYEVLLSHWLTFFMQNRPENFRGDFPHMQGMKLSHYMRVKMKKKVSIHVPEKLVSLKNCYVSKVLFQRCVRFF